MLDKKSRLAKCLRLQVKGDMVIQEKPCNESPYHKFNSFCRGCEEKTSCNFMGLRGFKISKKTKNLLHGPYFPPTKKQDPLQQLKSARFNTNPPSSTATNYALNKIKSGFQKLLLRQKNASQEGYNQPIRRENLEDNRHYCDYCYTALFNYHFVCSTCGLELCPDCYNKLITSNDSNLISCTRNSTHIPDEFVLISKIPEETLDSLIKDTVTSDIEYKNVNNDTENSFNNNKDVQNKNDTKDQSTNNFDIECTNNITDANIKCKNNTNEDINKKSSVTTYTSATEKVQSNPFNTPIPDKKLFTTIADCTNLSYLTQINSSNYDSTYPILNEPILLQNYMDIDSSVLQYYLPPPPIGFKPKDTFSPIFENNLHGYTQNPDTFKHTNLFNSRTPTLHTGLDSNYDLMKLPPEFTHNQLVFNHMKNGKRHLDIDSPIMTRRKRRGIENHTVYHQYTISRQNSPGINIVDNDNDCDQSQYSHIPPLPSSSIHYVYPETVENDLYRDFRLNEEYGAYLDYSSYNKEVPRVILTPKSRKVRSSPQVTPLQDCTPSQVISSRQDTPLPEAIPSPSPLPPNAPNMLNVPASSLTSESFQAYWQSHQPAIITDSIQKSQLKWTPKFFENLCKKEVLEATDIDGNIFEVTGEEYFRAFSSRIKRKELCSSLGSTEVLKIKDLPPNKSLKSVFPELYQDFMKTLVTPEYCTADGYFNLANRLPEEYLPPDLGPKMFISYGSDETGKTGRTNLHCDMTDAVNIMYYADNKTSKVEPIAPALWHIFSFESLEKLGQYICKYKNTGSLHPILDHAFYLDQDDLQALKKEYGVVPFTLYQNPGDTVYIPAGCAHQVTNFNNSIKCAFDFISPENVDRSIYISDTFKSLKKEDKLQVATTLAFAWTSLKSDQM